jgi:F0F1-type ATP synthase epsilon subunit
LSDQFTLPSKPAKAPARQSILHVKVISPAQIYYEGSADSVSAHNKVGPFDILSDHTNFFSLLTAGDIAINTGTQVLKFPIKDGIVKVTNNIVTLFIYLPDD